MYEVFDCVSGKTIGYYMTKALAKGLVAKYCDERCFDYELANCGFYIIASMNGREWVVNRVNNSRDAERDCMMLNQASDTVTYHVKHIP